MNVLICLFHRYEMIANVAKYKTMTCKPGKLRYRISEGAVGQWYMGRGATYHDGSTSRTAE